MKTLTLLSLSAAALALTAAAPAPKVTVANAWCRPAPAAAMAGGCYVTLTAGADDRLVAVETSAADRGEIHTMSMDGGIMRMRKLSEGLALPTGKTISLKPGADHIMLIGPKVTLSEGTKVSLTLKFQKAPAVKVDAVVRAPAAAAMPGMVH